MQKITEALGEQHEAFNEFIMKWSSDLLLLKEFLSTSNDLLLSLIQLVSNKIGPQKNTAFDDNSLMHIGSQTQTHFTNKKRENKIKPQAKTKRRKRKKKKKKQKRKIKNGKVRTGRAFLLPIGLLNGSTIIYLNFLE